MSVVGALTQEELTLARTIATRLAKVMHGLLSVGTAAVQMGTESARNFLECRVITPLGYLEVLRFLEVKPEHRDKIPLLQGRARELIDTTKEFFGFFLELANWRSLPPVEVDALAERAGASYALFCQRLGDFCTLLGIDSDFAQQATQDKQYLVAAFQSFQAADSH